MKLTNLISLTMTTLLYRLCGCFGYSTFEDNSLGNLIARFSFHNHFWLVVIANVAMVIHLVGEYQASCHQLFAIETTDAKWYTQSKFITNEFQIPIPDLLKPFKLNILKLICSILFVFASTFISILLPFFNAIVKLMGALSFPHSLFTSRWKSVGLIDGVGSDLKFYGARLMETTLLVEPVAATIEIMKKTRQSISMVIHPVLNF
ncbi:hypothetical protein Leryth_011179 [Lithospermum erythrorhizon]|nr:hypothetical protein Leryth_011179 [Lithospermum erythrorhizon]